MQAMYPRLSPSFLWLKYYVNNRHYGRCYAKEIIALCIFLEFYTHLEANSARSFQNDFNKCSMALNTIFFKQIVFLIYVVIFQPTEPP